MISTKGLNFKYNEQASFSFPDINLGKDENLLIIGSSGIGKTTLLHLLAGLLESNSGSINLYGQDISKLTQHQIDKFRGQNIGIVFQKPHFVNSLTVKENLQLAQYLGNKKDQNRIIDILSSLDILNKENKRPKKLSQGEKQRASIAMAIVNSPKLILADEPTSSLDDENCERVIKLLKKQASDFNAQLIVITHDNRLKKHFKKSIKL